jgi:hypothetical protein
VSRIVKASRNTRTIPFLLLSRPRDKCLAGTLEPSPAQELRKGRVAVPIAGKQSECSENGPSADARWSSAGGLIRACRRRLRNFDFAEPLDDGEGECELTCAGELHRRNLIRAHTIFKARRIGAGTLAKGGD